MNTLSTQRRAQVIGCLIEGNNIQAAVRTTGVAKNTIAKLLLGAHRGHIIPRSTGNRRELLRSQAQVRLQMARISRGQRSPSTRPGLQADS